MLPVCPTAKQGDVAALRRLAAAASLLMVVSIQLIAGPQAALGQQQQQQQLANQSQPQTGLQPKPNYLETARQITGILDRFMSLGYDKRVRPNYGGPPVEVNVTMRILSISSVSEVMMDFTADFYFRQTWHDPRLSFKKLGEIQTLYVGAEVSKKIWLPDTFFGNEKMAYFHEATTPNVFLRIDHSGEVYRSIRLTVTSSCPMNLQYFPMDRQRCTIEAESYGYNVKDIIYRWARKDTAVERDKEISLPQFDIVQTVQKYRLEELSSGTYSRLIAEIHFARRMGYYLIQIYIPSSLIVVISWVSFWLHRNASPARVQLGVTTVLTMTTLMSSTNAALPKISYVKSIDIFLGTCFVMVFAALLEYATVGYLGKRIAMRKAHAQHAQTQAQARLFAHLQTQGGGGGAGGMPPPQSSNGEPLAQLMAPTTGSQSGSHTLLGASPPGAAAAAAAAASASLNIFSTSGSPEFPVELRHSNNSTFWPNNSTIDQPQQQQRAAQSQSHDVNFDRLVAQNRQTSACHHHRSEHDQQPRQQRLIQGDYVASPTCAKCSGALCAHHQQQQQQQQHTGTCAHHQPHHNHYTQQQQCHSSRHNCEHNQRALAASELSHAANCHNCNLANGIADLQPPPPPPAAGQPQAPPRNFQQAAKLAPSADSAACVSCRRAGSQTLPRNLTLAQQQPSACCANYELANQIRPPAVPPLVQSGYLLSPQQQQQHQTASASLSPSKGASAAAAQAAATFVNLHRKNKGLPPSTNPNFAQFNSIINPPYNRHLETIFGIRPSDIDKYSRVVFPVCFVCFQLMYWIVYLHISAFLEPDQQQQQQGANALQPTPAPT